ncbi:IclR family transcriptional regulator [Halopenitus salinus]|uniref:IclR family transcriptional regulator n=1 Tax=Halopenitus salinus TaxID=1198295 RepID=A0ABD5UUQ7_9EURY
MSTENEGPRTIKSVETAFDVLEVIHTHGQIGVTEIANALDISKSAAHHHVTTLAQRNFLAKIDGQYRLGVRFLTYGGRARKCEDVFEMGRADVDELAHKTGETVRLIVENSGYGLTLYQSLGENVTEPHTHMGMMEYLHSTAAGKAFLAALPQAEAEAIIDERGLERLTTNTITSPDELYKELERIRSRGISFDNEEQFEGVRCIATTLIGESDDLLGAVSISAPTERMSHHRFRSELPRQLQSVTEEINRVEEYRFRHELPCISRTLSQ